MSFLETIESKRYLCLFLFIFLDGFSSRSVSQASFFGLVHLQMDNQCFKKHLPKKKTQQNLLLAGKSEECWLSKVWESWESINLLSHLNQGKE